MILLQKNAFFFVNIDSSFIETKIFFVRKRNFLCTIRINAKNFVMSSRLLLTLEGAGD